MPIAYNDFVKRPREEFEYTREQILELKKCKEDIEYFIKYVKIVNPDYGEIPFEPYDYQKKLIRRFSKYRFNVSLCSRQSGKTTVVAVYALWYSIFNEDKYVGIVSNKESSAKMILSRMKRMWESLPNWLKPGVEEYAKTGVTFDNHTRIIISATSADAFRGNTMNLLICDEFAFVPSGQAEDFWASNYPTVSASKEAKVIIISTPNGMFNIFHRIYTQSERGENTFKHTKVTWREVPGRDNDWAIEQKKNLGKQKFSQEFDVEFLGSTNTVIGPETLEVLLSSWEEPSKIDMNGQLKIYEKPVDGALYVIGVDTAKGTGEHSSVATIIRIDSIVPVKMKQVAVFKDNNTDVYRFTEIIDRLSYYYKNAFIMVENNSEGAAVINRLWWDFENENLVNSGSKAINLGIRASRTTKPKAVLLMKKIIEDGSLKIPDKDTVEELSTFIEEKDKFFGKDKPDDCVSALYWGLYILEMNILDEKYEFDENNDENDVWGLLADVQRDAEDWNWLYDSNVYD